VAGAGLDGVTEPARDDVAAVVVSYNVRDLLLRCIRSLRADGLQRIVVVDNASADGTPAAVAAEPDIDLVELERNVGFAGGANRGVARTDTPYVALVNPDEVVEPGCTATLVEALERDPGLALVGPRITTPDGRVYPSVRHFPGLVDAAGHAFLYLVWPDNPFSRRYRMVDWDHAEARDVDWVATTHVVVRRAAWDSVGGFDEGYFMYMEDADLCRRLRDAGWKLGYEPAAAVMHEIGRSTDQTPYRMIVAHHRSLWRYAVKTSTGWRRALLPLIAPALVVRVGLACVHRAIRRRPHAAP
jgi:N-acetylglucosaminyl-diphospho-decaprenol L-rhamnosyltransferase